MSQFHNIFCRSSDPLMRQEISIKIPEFWYGDGSPGLSFSGGDSGSPDWRKGSIILPTTHRPITVTWDEDRAVIAELVDEVIDKFGANLPAGVVEHLRNCQEVLGIEIFPEDLDEDSWEFLDLVQAFFARRLDGLVVAGDGIYDQALKQLVER